jgi:hypothetical protein
VVFGHSHSLYTPTRGFRIDALLAEAHQLNFTADEILKMVRDRKTAMDDTTAESAEARKKQTGRKGERNGTDSG